MRLSSNILSVDSATFWTQYPFDGGSNAPFRGGKGSTWEGGSRVPAVWWMPGVIPSWSSCLSPITNMDVLPTLAELVGFEMPTDRVYDGVSVLQHLNDSTRCHDRKKDPHEFVYFWRCGELYALRYGQYKAHWVTRNGFGKEPPFHHDPPIMFNVEWDPAESVRLNTSDSHSEYGKVLSTMQSEYERAVREMKENDAVPQFNEQNFFTVPCCNKGFNYTEALEYIEEGEVGLGIWDECVCNYKP